MPGSNRTKGQRCVANTKKQVEGVQTAHLDHTAATLDHLSSSACLVDFTQTDPFPELHLVLRLQARTNMYTQLVRGCTR